MHQFIDKIESNSLWIKWMKVRWLCPGPGSCTRCSPHAAAKVWVSYLRQKGADHIITYFFNGLLNSRLLKVFSRHHTFCISGYYWITNWIQEKKTQSTLLWSESWCYCIYSWWISRQGILKSKYFTKQNWISIKGFIALNNSEYFLKILIKVTVTLLVQEEDFSVISAKLIQPRTSSRKRKIFSIFHHMVVMNIKWS